MTVLVFLHIAVAVFTIGPLTATAVAGPRAIRSGREGLSLLRWLAGSTRIYAAVSVVAAVLGAAAVSSTDHKWTEFWLPASVTLYVVAIALVLILLVPDLAEAVTELETAPHEVPSWRSARIAAVGGGATLVWLIIVLLMVWEPGK
jgi:hypothetical protein